MNIIKERFIINNNSFSINYFSKTLYKKKDYKNEIKRLIFI